MCLSRLTYTRRDISRENEGLKFALPVTIGNNVWIGASVVILLGVSIGENGVIGTGSVVTGNGPPKW